jgi:energy-coupling factor transporter ATPase
MPLIEVRNLTYNYPDSIKPALNNVNLTIEKGEFVILTGPSGCGKTTLCRCFNGLIPHFYSGALIGNVIVAGLSVREWPTFKLAQKVGFVFQNPENQLFALSVEKDVAFGLENLGLPREEIRERVEWALDMTGIVDLREMAPYELSGGQQQRVAIASVLAMKPEILVLDEPTSFLDPAAAKTIFEVLGQFNRELSMTVILVEHRLDLTAPYSSRVVVMDHGQIKLDGTPREILSSAEVRALGVSVPRVMKLYQTLIAEGVKLAQIPLTVDEAAHLIRGILNVDRD